MKNSSNMKIFENTQNHVTLFDGRALCQPRSKGNLEGDQRKVSVQDADCPDGFRLYFPIKRLLDIFFSLMGLIVSAPLWLIFAILIKLDSPGPVFYFKLCYTKNRRKFRQWKFRSMIDNAEDESNPVLATPDDKRITRVGWFLRKTALDELPQLINILVGDMSFVGPRPQRVSLVDGKYALEIPNYHKRHQITPGLTGLAQVYGRYDTAPRDKLRYDLLYIKKCGFWLDLKLILLSFWITLRAKWQERGKSR